MQRGQRVELILHFRHRMPSLQSFIEGVSEAPAWYANVPSDSSGTLTAIWLYITACFAGAVDNIENWIHQLSEWLQKPGMLCPDSNP